MARAQVGRQHSAAGRFSGDFLRSTTLATPQTSKQFGNDDLAVYRRALGRSVDLLAGRWGAGRRFSVDAASNRAASESNMGVGPFQRNWSTSSKSGMSVRSVASVRKSIARSCSRQRVSARALALAAFTRHSRQSAGIDSIWRNLARTAAEDFAPQPGRPG